MTEVKMPVLLDANLQASAMLHPSKGTLKLTMDGVSEATLTLEDRAETIPMHGWVKIYNILGFVGVFRRSSRGRNIGTDNSYTLRHGIDVLQDSVWNAEQSFEGTMTEFLTALLNKQTQLIQGPGDSEPVKPWALGTCADVTTTVKKGLKVDDNLLDLLESVVEEGSDYYFTYDQSVWPWQVSLAAKPGTVDSEFRLDRNMQKCQIKDNDSELCTRLILNVNKMVKDDAKSSSHTDVNQNACITRTFDNTTAQANYGIIVKTADIDVTRDTFPNGPFPESDEYAAWFMARRAEPMLQVEIDGTVLKGITGDDWDESKLATYVRVALPDYATAIAQRCVSVTYPDLYGTPERVTVSLANALPTFTRSMKATQKTVASHSKSGRASKRESKDFQQHFQITDENGNILRQAGLKLDANGMLVYADDQVNMIGARFNVQADQIGMVVGTNTGGNFIKGGEIALSINSQPDRGTQTKILLDADVIDINGIVTALVSYDVTTASLTTVNTAVFGGEVTFNDGADFNNTDVSGIVNLAADSISCDDISINGYTDVIVGASVNTSTNTLTLTHANGGTTTFSKAGSSASDILLGSPSSTSSRPSGTGLTSWRSGLADAVNNRKYFKFKATISGGTGEKWYYVDFT